MSSAASATGTRGERAATDEGLRTEMDRVRAVLAATLREIAEDDEGYAGVDE